VRGPLGPTSESVNDFFQKRAPIAHMDGREIEKSEKRHRHVTSIPIKGSLQAAFKRIDGILSFIVCTRGQIHRDFPCTQEPCLARWKGIGNHAFQQDVRHRSAFGD
ncbi:hypothetical protein, partial [Sphingobium sp.]|uniref:hypothetical protein n=1 Tax=Sphingobium sp. TaxID=1912891 RepID=UPI00257DFDDA